MRYYFNSYLKEQVIFGRVDGHKGKQKRMNYSPTPASRAEDISHNVDITYGGSGLILG